MVRSRMLGCRSTRRVWETRLMIQPQFRSLVRTNSVFWITSGIDVSLGWRGLQVGTDSLASVAAGGVAMATPDAPGPPAAGGRRFVLHMKPESEWKSWRPRLPWGASWFDDGTVVPTSMRLTLSGSRRSWGISRSWSTTVWGQSLKGNRLVCPVMNVPLSELNNVRVEIAGQTEDVDAESIEQVGDLVVISGVTIEFPRAPLLTTRPAEAPEDCVVIAGHRTLPVSQLRWSEAAPWRLDIADSVDDSWSGASVVARSDAALLGILTWSNGHPHLATLAELD